MDYNQAMAILSKKVINTPLGKMCVLASYDAIYMLEFCDAKNFSNKISKIQSRYELRQVLSSDTIYFLEAELADYFAGKITTFKSPLKILGTEFQKKIWYYLQKIPCGSVRSYKEIAQVAGSPSGYRAAANAISANHFAIIIPCHRVISSSGALGGYASGANKKQWLLRHEGAF